MLLASAALALLAVASPVEAQQSPDAVTQSFAEQWARPSGEGLMDVLDPTGVLIAFDGREHRDLERGRLLATIEELRDGMVGGGVRLLRVVPVVGSANRAFAELIWESVMVGTSESIEHTVYLGLARRDDRWWVNEIRLLR